jgi:sulfonate transport system substrate-binding protein
MKSKKALTSQDGRWGRKSCLPKRQKRVLTAVVAALVVVTGCSSGSAKPAASGRSSSRANPAGAKIHFADLLKNIQTILTTNNLLQNVPYTVDWSEFTSGPPVVAAETGGSVDVGVMAETPTIFAQAAGDPLEVIAASEGSPGSTPCSVVVSPSSSITSMSNLRGKTVAVQEGTTEQYVLVRNLQQAGVPYSSVKIDNVNIVAGEAALESGRVDAYVTTEPLTSLMVQAGKGRVLKAEANTASLQYITASRSALEDPNKRSAIVDLVTRIFAAETKAAKDPAQGIQTYVKLYGVPLAVAQRAAASVRFLPVPISQNIIQYQRQEANTFQQLGLVAKKLNVANLFDVQLNQQIMSAWNSQKGSS